MTEQEVGDAVISALLILMMVFTTVELARVWRAVRRLERIIDERAKLEAAPALPVEGEK